MLLYCSKVICILGLLLLLGSVSTADAQFSKPVVILRGKITSGETGKPQSLRVSARLLADTAREFTASISNAATGEYLLVLQQDKEYRVTVSDKNGLVSSMPVRTALMNSTVTIYQDFIISGKIATK